jgi:SseB protein N-terminal domain
VKLPKEAVERAEKTKGEKGRIDDRRAVREAVAMDNRLDQLIGAFVSDQSDQALRALHTAFLTEQLHIPVSEPVKELEPRRYDVPVICIRTATGAGAIPVFTSLEHLFEWKPQGCLYICVRGRALLTMAIGMSDIAEINVNPNGVPRGCLLREEFEKMLEIP